MLPERLTVKNGELPDQPGVYFYYADVGDLLYVGKATSLKKRVGSYFTKAHDDRIGEMVGKIAKIDYIVTPTVIEALVLEANQIKAKQPHYNVLMTDDKTYLYLVITKEKFPRPLLMRGLELEKLDVNPFDATLSKQAKKKFIAVFGPYTSGHQLKKALDLLRKSIPWSDCQPPEITGRTRSCFNVHIGKCPGICAGVVDAKSYRRVIRHLILFFEGKKAKLIKLMEKEMKEASKAHRFEEAARLRNNISALQHIRDVALIMKEDVELPYEKTKDEGIDLEGRIEAYDISNISGESAVGSMVVFEEGRPAKSLYRKFRIKTVQGSNDFASMAEVLRRRLTRAAKGEKGWPLPQIMVIDGGEGQVSAVKRVMDELGVYVPLLGIAKGFDRKQDRLVYDHSDVRVSAVANRGKETFQKARDESHRFAVSYHRKLRGKKSLGTDK